jgi:hypothetical protein
MARWGTSVLTVVGEAPVDLQLPGGGNSRPPLTVWTVPRAPTCAPAFAVFVDGFMLASSTHVQVLLKTTFGDIDIELWSRECPKACRNFVQLALEGVGDPARWSNGGSRIGCT